MSSTGQLDMEETQAKVEEVVAVKIEPTTPEKEPPAAVKKDEPTIPVKEEAPSKYSMRKQVWTHFDKNGLVSFPRPVRGRIPNFHGAVEAAAKLVELDAFKNAKVVKVNPDKPQESVRLSVLQANKHLLVPCSRLKDGVFMEVVLPDENRDKNLLKKAISRRGMSEFGKVASLDTELKIDMVVLGSVAVSREGRRIGKGEGFGDLEFGVLSHIGAITDDTVVVTTVHDSQVFESLPAELFEEFDVPVDIIVTPTEVIQVQEKLPRPKQLIWSILSQRRINLMTALKEFRDKEVANGKECHLKEEDTDEETERNRRRLHQVRSFYRFPRKRLTTAQETNATGDGDNTATTGQQTQVKEKEPSRRYTRFRKPKQRPVSQSETPAINPTDVRPVRNGKQRRRYRPEPFQFSLRIGNIASNVRVRDLKNALAERNVKPTEITWRGHRGFAFLHFAKPRKEPDTPVQVDTIVASLQDIKIGGDESENNGALVVEPAKPISRIETTDITSV